MMGSLRFWTRSGIVICAFGVIIFNISILFSWTSYLTFSTLFLIPIGMLMIIIPFYKSFSKDINPFAQYLGSKKTTNLFYLGMILSILGTGLSIVYSLEGDIQPLWVKIIFLLIVSIGAGFIILLFFQKKNR